MFGLELHPAVIHYPIALGVVGADLGPVRHAPKAVAALVRAGTAVAGPGRRGSGLLQRAVRRRSRRRGGRSRAEIDRHEHGDLVDRRARPGDALAWATVAGGGESGSPRRSAVAAAGLVLWAAHLGGRLVYVYGAGQVPKATVEPLQTPAEETAKEIEHE